MGKFIEVTKEKQQIFEGEKTNSETVRQDMRSIRHPNF